MERIETLKQLRERVCCCLSVGVFFRTSYNRFCLIKGTLPEGFEQKYPTKAELLRRMVARDTETRPTANEILNSDFLPPKLEDEILKEALRYSWC